MHSIQDKSALVDAELARSTVQENMLGMPISAAGQSAVVFHVVADGSAAAVRFFTRPPRDGSVRYRALEAHLKARPCEAIVPARWVEEAITVDGNVRPAVWMPWAPGRPLNLLVEDLLEEPRRLHVLAEEWLKALDALRAADMAHGDLQNGNVLVTDDLEVALVDLDGVWVPSLTGRPPNETGHRCFQHRRRSTRHWGSEMDSFSGFLIYSSLVALSADPTLWRFHQGENLILSAQDLLDPGAGEAWEGLLRSRSVLVRMLAEQLLEFARAEEPPTGSVKDLVEATGDLEDITIKRITPGDVPMHTATSSVEGHPAPMVGIEQEVGPGWWLPDEQAPPAQPMGQDAEDDESVHGTHGTQVAVSRRGVMLSTVLLAAVAGSIAICMAAVLRDRSGSSFFGVESMIWQFLTGSVVLSGGTAWIMARAEGRSARRTIVQTAAAAVVAGIAVVVASYLFLRQVDRVDYDAVERLATLPIVLSVGAASAVIYGLVGLVHSIRTAGRFLIAGAVGGGVGAIPIAIYGVVGFPINGLAVETSAASIAAFLTYWLFVGISIAFAQPAEREEATP